MPTSEIPLAEIECLQELLSLRARTERHWLTIETGAGSAAQTARFSFADIETRAQARACALRASGLEPGRTCLLIFDNDEKFAINFFAVLFAGMVPVSWHHSGLLGKSSAYAERTLQVGRHCEAQVVLTTERFARAAGLSQLAIQVLTHEQLLHSDKLDRLAIQSWKRSAVSATALVQYTSGSVGTPKAVELTHQNIIANVISIGQRTATTNRDVLLSWLPLFHDMGLIGSLLFPLTWGIPAVLMSPRTFVLAPQRWLWAIARHRATICPAPNFAYQLAANVISEQSIHGLDLSSWRLAVNGAEQVRSETTRAFEAKFAPHGFRPESMFPVYGLAETVLAACFPEPGRGASFDCIDRQRLALHRHASPSDGPTSATRMVANVGKPMPGHALRIVAEGSDEPVAEREVGTIQLAGPSVMQGYYRSREASERVLRPGGWLNTGDRGYLAGGGDLYVLGRDATVIKRRGLRYDAADIEARVASVHGVRAGCVAACGAENQDLGSDDLAIYAEVDDDNVVPALELQRAIAEKVRDTVGAVPDRIVLLNRGQLPKTTSGKIRHAACAQLVSP